ncbi:unnamed protein product, partial [Symbiodinium sp. CCMP2456]
SQSARFLALPLSAKSMTSMATMRELSSRQVGSRSRQSLSFAWQFFVGDPSRSLRWLWKIRREWIIGIS